MRCSLLLALLVACGSSNAETTRSDASASGGGAGTFEMRDRSAGSTSTSGGELGHLQPSSSGQAVATDRTEREARPNDVDADPIERREGERPLTPTERDRNRIFRSLRPDVERCLRGLHARFTVRLRVRSSGVVSEALVTGEHLEGTDRAHCIEAAFRGVMFPAFRDPETTMHHDYRF